MEQWFFEDFTSGQHLPAVERVVSADEAARFAAEFDPLAPERAPLGSRHPAGEAPPASEWFVASLGMRMICDAFIGRTAALGAPGVDVVEWPQAVHPGDRLRLDVRILTVRPSRSRPEMGLVGVELILTNQRSECVMKQNNVLLVQRRTMGLAP